MEWLNHFCDGVDPKTQDGISPTSAGRTECMTA